MVFLVWYAVMWIIVVALNFVSILPENGFWGCALILFVTIGIYIKLFVPIEVKK